MAKWGSTDAIWGAPSFVWGQDTADIAVRGRVRLTQDPAGRVALQHVAAGGLRVVLAADVGAVRLEAVPAGRAALTHVAAGHVRLEQS